MHKIAGFSENLQITPETIKRNEKQNQNFAMVEHRIAKNGLI